MRSPLQSPRLRRIIAAYTINRFGTWLGYVALSIAVYDHTHSALAVAALLVAGQALPAFVVPAVVARVESSTRRGELSWLYWIEAVTTAALAILLSRFWLPGMLVLVALDGTAALAASALMRAELAKAAREEALARAGAGPGAVPADGGRPQPATTAGSPADEAAHEAERQANAALNMAFSVTFVLGPAVGGAIVAGAGAPAALFIDVGTFVVCGALLLDLQPNVEEAGGDSVRARLQAAWRHINEAPSLRSLLLVEAIALVFAESAGPIEVAYAKSTLHAGDGGFGLLVASWGAGAVLGSLVFARSLSRPLGALLSAGTLAVGMAYLGYAGAPSLLLACGAALLGGIGNGVELPSLTSIVQRITPQELHARVLGAVESLVAICVTLALPLGGLLVALSSPRIAFLIVGVGAIATTPALLRLSRGGVARAAARPHDGSQTGSPVGSFGDS
ncbi:MAG TPA: MFS transporter [Solirubrobacteraceae bacterium]|nr:MFS transporter [Solirubrobacteraceae bacterium]